MLTLLRLFFSFSVTATAEFPGDFRNGALDYGWDTFGPDTQLRKRAIELNNGRAAMIGILGLMVHEQIPGNPVVRLRISKRVRGVQLNNRLRVYVS